MCVCVCVCVCVCACACACACVHLTQEDDDSSLITISIQHFIQITHAGETGRGDRGHYIEHVYYLLVPHSITTHVV